MAGSVAKLVNPRLSKTWLVLPNVRKGANCDIAALPPGLWRIGHGRPAGLSPSHQHRRLQALAALSRHRNAAQRAAWEADKRDLNALRDGLMALAVKFHKSINPDDTTVKLKDSVAAIGELRNARRVREMAQPPTSAKSWRMMRWSCVSAVIDWSATIPDDPQSPVRKALRERRRALCMTQDKAASALRMSRLTYHRLEAGLRQLHFDEITALHKLFRIEPEELLGDLAPA
jgi:DNA-binding XRE family transcriptional regulator